MKELLSRALRQAAAAAGTSAAIRFWDGTEERLGEGDPAFTITFRNAGALRRALGEGFLGFGEAYMEGEIEVEGSWDRLFALAMRSDLRHGRPGLLRSIRFLANRLWTRGTRAAARRNIRHHYDLGNDFYRLWLDESMTYSCAYFRSPEDDLETAQRAKLDLICRKLALEPGQTLLDVGCGWGSMLLHAAREYAVRGVGCTLSREQAKLARERIREAGLADRVEIRVEDYREVTGRFDRWVSIGMFEHVGRAFIPEFVRHIRRVLRPGGVGLLHTIGKDRRTPGDPWTLTYIFPGGYLPSLGETLTAMGEGGLAIADVENLRLHYALTLDHWRRRFERHASRIESMYDSRFVRMWRLFLVSSAAGFRYGDTRVYQILFGHGPTREIPMTRENWYR